MNGQSKNFLLVFTGFHADDFIPSAKRAEWEVLHASDFLKKRYSEMIIFLRRKRHCFVVGRPDLSQAPAGFLISLMLIVAHAREKYVVDSDGKRWYPYAHALEERSFLGKTASFFCTALLLYLRLLRSLCYGLLQSARIGSICGSMYLVFSILSVLPTRRMMRLPRKLKSVFFLRTDYVGTFLVGGSYTHMRGFCNALQKKGVQVSILAHEVPEDMKKNHVFHPIRYSSYGPMPEVPEMAHNSKFFFECFRLARIHRPDMLYHRYSLMHISSLLVSRILNIPLVIEYNGSDVWIREKWGGKIFFKHLALIAEKVILNQAHYISVVSEVLGDQLLQQGIAREKIILSPNGVDTERFSPLQSGDTIRERLGLDASAILIGFVGSFGPWHGVDILAQAVGPVIQKYSHSHFLFIGNGALRPRVEDIIRMSNTRASVTFLENIPHDDVPQYLRACDILASPHVRNVDGSRFFGSPTKLFEYMAVERAIIASKLEQLGDVLEHDVSAWLIPPNDVAALVEGIVLLAHDSELRSRLASHARHQVISAYTWDHAVARTFDHMEKPVVC